LYLNQGQWRFDAVPDAGGAAMPNRHSMGTSLADLDGDGDLDLIVTTMGGPNRVFHNDGTGHFEPVTNAGLHAGQGSTTMALADVNGDGALDLYVGNYKRIALRDSLPPSKMQFSNLARQVGPNEYEVKPRFEGEFEVETIDGKPLLEEEAEKDRLYLNDGDGTFTHQSWTEVFRGPEGTPSETVPKHWTLTVRLEDLNGDGHADLYACNDFESPDLLYWGTAGTQFVKAEETVLRTTSHATMSIAVSDIDRDGHTDFFLSDMLGRGYERRKLQNPSQMPLPHLVGKATKRAQEMQNTLQLNRGDTTFAEISALAGVEATGWTWSSRFLDVNLDGYEDLLASTGHAYDVQNADAQRRTARLEAKMRSPERKLRLIFRYPKLNLPTMAFRNRGDGSFEAMPKGWGLGATDDVGHGLATGDFDRDGDLDVIVNRLNQSLGVYRNKATQSRVALRLIGQAPNRGAVGASVRLLPPDTVDTDVPAQTKRVIAGGEYLSDSEAMLSFAMGTAERSQVEVTWPDGETSRTTVHSGRIYEIPAPGARVDWASTDSTASDAASVAAASSSQAAAPTADRPARTSASAPPDTRSSEPSDWFENVSDRIAHTHTETKYADFQHQPLLQRRLSQQGPGAAWADLDGDGDDDLLIGTGRGGQIAYYRNDGGRFTRVRGGALGRTYEHDVTGLVAAPHADGATVFVGHSNYETSAQEPERPSSILVYESSASGLERTDSLAFGASAVGPLALADVDGDGDLDLFAGGRHVPGEYPEDATSVLYVNGDGSYESRSLGKVGLVSAATFADMDTDGDPDLVLATEWGPLRYFENRNGRFVDRTKEQGLATASGFWRGVGVGDLNEDGRLDLVATNWGWNSKYGRPAGRLDAIDTPRLDQPLRTYYTDFDRNGTVEFLETKYYEERDEYLPYQSLPSIAQALPYVQNRISSYEEFSTASLKDVVGKTWLNRAETKDVNTLSHMVFLNTETGFEGHALPLWAQLTAGFSPSIADLDGDGHLDVLLSQNFFATESETPRQDAGRALLLRGDGTGAFTPVKGHRSGLIAYGEQRAAPLADVDRDGRVDVLVTQNGAQTKLFRNVGAMPGLRVRLDGPAGNPRGIGATVRLRYENGDQGPALPITAGAGYWAQHSLTPVLGHGPRSVAAVEVRWPDGTTSTHPVDGTPGVVSPSFEQ
ncbi:MAG: FG-GAP-like repeat-containing protein, partial [Salinibacter sp.]